MQKIVIFSPDQYLFKNWLILYPDQANKCNIHVYNILFMMQSLNQETNRKY